MDIAGRRDAALRLMESEGVDIMLVAPNELARIDTVFHLTGYRALGETVAVLSRGAKPMLVVTPEWEGGRAEARASGWSVHPTDDLAKTVASLFPRGLPAGRTATVGLGKLPSSIGNTRTTS